MIKKAKKTSSKKISQIPTGILVLENKTIFKGIGIGYQGTATGEVCFNTSLTGYQEIISDPSYAGQIINFTFPHIGNVGTNKEDLESDKVWTKGVIFNSEITFALCEAFSFFRLFILSLEVVVLSTIFSSVLTFSETTIGLGAP